MEGRGKGVLSTERPQESSPGPLNDPHFQEGPVKFSLIPGAALVENGDSVSQLPQLLSDPSLFCPQIHGEAQTLDSPMGQPEGR